MEILRDLKEYIVIAHAFAAAVGVGGATITDVFFFRFLKDSKISAREANVMRILSEVIWAALLALVITGLLLYIPDAARLNQTPKFLVKVIAVAVLIANGVLLNLYLTPKLTKISFGERHHHEPGELFHIRKIAFASGAVSITSWYTAFILGSLRSLEIEFLPLFAIYSLLIAGAIVGSQVMEYVFERRARR